MHCALCHVLSATCTGRLGQENSCRLSIKGLHFQGRQTCVEPSGNILEGMSLGSLVGQTTGTHTTNNTQLLEIVCLPVAARKELGTVY